MMIPKHVHEIARKIQDELEQQKQEEPEDWETEEALKEIKLFRKMLNHSSIKDASYVKALELLQQIIQTSYVLSASAIERIYQPVEIEPELVWAMNQAYNIHPKMRKELNLVQGFMRDVPNCSWGNTDHFAKFRCFKLVRTQNQWERILKKFYGYDFGRNLRNFGNLKHLRVGYVSSEMEESKFANIVREELIQSGDFDRLEEAFKEWFLIGTKGTYYIYIPE